MHTTRIRRGVGAALLGGAVLAAGASAIGPARAAADKIGVNVLLTGPVTDAALASLGEHGTVLDVIPAIHAVMLRADEADLPAIQALTCVAAANADVELDLGDFEGLPVPDL